MLVLFSPLSSIIEPGVGEMVRQTAFALSDLADEGAEVGAATTAGGYGGGSPKGHLLAAFALQCDGGRMPLVDLAKGHFAALVVCLDAFEDLHHRLYLFLPPFYRQGVRARRHLLVGWEANPSLLGRQVAILRLQRDLRYLA